MNLIEKLKHRPEILHGIIAGLVLFAAKMVLYASGNWMYRVGSTFNFVAFVIIFVAMLMGGNGEKKLRSEFRYFRALLSAMITIFIAVFISLIGDQVAYRTKPKLAEEVKTYQIEQLQESLPKMKFLSASLKEDMMAEMENSKPEELYSLGAFFSSLLTFFALDSLWALLVAAITRKAAVIPGIPET